jgi:hypothetical protein
MIVNDELGNNNIDVSCCEGQVHFLNHRLYTTSLYSSYRTLLDNMFRSYYAIIRSYLST